MFSPWMSFLGEQSKGELLSSQEDLNDEREFLFGAKEFPTEDSLSSGNTSFALLWSERQA